MFTKQQTSATSIFSAPRTAAARLVCDLAADDAGFILSAELVLILTIGVLAMVVGLNAIAKSVVQELNDVAQGVGSVNQSFYYRGLKGHKGYVPGSNYQDNADECDNAAIQFPTGNVKYGRGGGGKE